MSKAADDGYSGLCSQDLEQLFLSRIEETISQACDSGRGKGAPQRIIIALSGGLDSMVLLHALSKLKGVSSILAVHVNHQLSDSSDQWVRHCQEACSNLNIPLQVETISISNKTKSIEAEARRLRYRAIEQHLRTGDLVVTGHHKNDQIETILMKFLRASDNWGIFAQRTFSRRNKQLLIRPMLDFDRRQLQLLARHWQVSYVTDSSNEDTSFERNWWRHKGIPLLESRYPSLSTKLLTAWQRQKSQQKVIATLIEPLYFNCIDDCQWPETYAKKLMVNQLNQFDNEVQILIIKRWLTDVYQALDVLGKSNVEEPRHEWSDDERWDDQSLGDQWSGVEYANLIKIITSENRSTSQSKPAKTHRNWGDLYYWDHGLYAIPKPSDKSVNKVSIDLLHKDQPSIKWTGTTYIRIGELQTINKERLCSTVYFPDTNENLKHKSIKIVAAADVTTKRIKLKNRPTKTFKHIFQELRVPPWLRSHWPVLVEDDNRAKVICLIGLAVDEGYQRDRAECSHQYSLKQKFYYYSETS